MRYDVTKYVRDIVVNCTYERSMKYDAQISNLISTLSFAISQIFYFDQVFPLTFQA